MALNDHLEAPAVAPCLPKQINDFLADGATAAATVSIAISLKRIADTLEHVANGDLYTFARVIGEAMGAGR